MTDEFYVVNESGLDLNTHIGVDHPFYLINDKNERVNKMDILLKESVQISIKVYFHFIPDKKSDLRIIKRILEFEYDEYPNKVIFISF